MFLLALGWWSKVSAYDPGQPNLELNGVLCYHPQIFRRRKKKRLSHTNTCIDIKKGTFVSCTIYTHCCFNVPATSSSRWYDGIQEANQWKWHCCHRKVHWLVSAIEWYSGNFMVEVSLLGLFSTGHMNWANLSTFYILIQATTLCSDGECINTQHLSHIRVSWHPL